MGDHELELIGDRPAHRPGLLVELRPERALETGDREPRDENLAEQQHHDREQHQPAENSPGAGDCCS